jgi:hypothetical protein
MIDLPRMSSTLNVVKDNCCDTITDSVSGAFAFDFTI